MEKLSERVKTRSASIRCGIAPNQSVSFYTGNIRGGLFARLAREQATLCCGRKRSNRSHRDAQKVFPGGSSN
jgi:hypothetical protein